MIRKCPNCGEQYIVDYGVSDYVHKCNSGNKFTDEEDVLIIGNWEDENGSGTIPKQVVMIQGISDKDKKGNKFTIRGNRKSTHRQRQRYEYVSDLI